MEHFKIIDNLIVHYVYVTKLVYLCFVYFKLIINQLLKLYLLIFGILINKTMFSEQLVALK